MDFFGAQDRARRRTWQLAGLFAAAVLALVALTNLLVATVYSWVAGFGYVNPFDPVATLRLLPGRYWFWITAVVVGGIGLASLYKYLWLRGGGGRTVAESLGGRLVLPGTDDPRERRLLNVVEEMAIAAGLPVPPVYLIPQPSINAFAAGFGHADAVLGINQGTLEHLSRDELQGVVGHEFSHLLNGDSLLNLRLLALLHGILFIGLVGEGLLRGALPEDRRSRRVGSAGLPILALGAGLTVIGYAGTFFGRLIQAAVSRQREYLADAAAVQFTRNPRGLAGALKKIGGLLEGSTMRGAAAREASHLFFGPVGDVWLDRLTATHPPLEQRIRALDPGWDGRLPVLLSPGLMTELGIAEAPIATALAGATPGTTHEANLPLAPDADAVVAAAGQVDAAAVAAAATLIDGLPAVLHQAARDPWSARALVYALVLAGASASLQGRARLLEGQTDPGLVTEALRLAPAADGLDESRRLVLVELAMPALKGMSARQYQDFVRALVALIRLDARIDLFEWVLNRLLVRDLRAHFGPAAPPALRHRTLAQCGPAVSTLLSALAREEPARCASPRPNTGGPEEPHQLTAFREGLAAAGLEGHFDAEADPDFQRLNRALQQLRTLQPLQKPRLLKACAATVLADERLSPRQSALLQGIGAALDCPLPPALGTRPGAG